MNRTKLILQIGKIAALCALLLLCVSPAYMKEKDSGKPSPSELRLVLAPKAHLQVALMPMGKDSAEAIVTIAVPDSSKNQRHLCRIEANYPIRLATEPRYKWALRRDTLMVLSAVPLQIRLPRHGSSGAATAQLRFHYQNLDRNAKEIKSAMLELLPEEAMAGGTQKPDSTKASSPDTSAASSALPIQFSNPDSTAASFAADGPSTGIIYVVIAILLILFFGCMSWLLTWSQRRRQNNAMQDTATAFPRFQQMQSPTPAAAGDDAGKNITDKTEPLASPQNQELALATPAFTDVPVASSNGHDAALTAIITQLHELSTTVQQILANQRQANQQLAEMANSTFAISSSPTTLALFDILNDDPEAKQSRSSRNGNALPSQLRIQFAESGTDSMSVKLGSSALEVYTNADHKINGLSVNLAAPSKLRILFASAESNNEPAAEPLPASSIAEPLLQ